jgi:hypothetical protein
MEWGSDEAIFCSKSFQEAAKALEEQMPNKQYSK